MPGAPSCDTVHECHDPHVIAIANLNIDTRVRKAATCWAALDHCGAFGKLEFSAK